MTYTPEEARERKNARQRGTVRKLDMPLRGRTIKPEQSKSYLAIHTKGR